MAIFKLKYNFIISTDEDPTLRIESSAITKTYVVFPQNYILILNPQSGVTMLNNIVDNVEQCRYSKTLFKPVFINKLFIYV